MLMLLRRLAFVPQAPIGSTFIWREENVTMRPDEWATQEQCLSADEQESDQMTIILD